MSIKNKAPRPIKRVFDISESHIRAALTVLGWIPPEAKFICRHCGKELVTQIVEIHDSTKIVVDRCSNECH